MRRLIIGLIIVMLWVLPARMVPYNTQVIERNLFYKGQSVTAGDLFLPFQIYPSTAGWHFAVGDLDNDNLTQEVICTNNSKIIAFNSNGNVLWVVNNISTPDTSIGDFDRDGYTDDFYVPTSEAYTKTGVLIQSAVNGSIHYTNSTSKGYKCTIGDVNQDGYADDIVGEVGNTSSIYYPYLSAFSYLWLAGNPFPSQTYWNFSIGSCFPYQYLVDDIAMGDIDEDGRATEIVFTTPLNHTYALNETGALLWSFPMGGVLLLGDFDEDGNSNEVALNSRDGYLYVIKDGGQLWNTSVGKYGYGFSMADLDHDGFEDELVFLRSFDKDLAAYDNQGNCLWNYSLSQTRYTLIKVIDLIGTGFRDSTIVCDSSGYIYVYNNLGQLIGGGIAQNTHYFGDFDGDEIADDMIGTYYNDLCLYRFGAPRIQCAFDPATPHNYTESVDFTPFHFNISSQEFNIALQVNLSTPFYNGASHIEITPGDNQLVRGALLKSGSYNVTLSVQFEGEGGRYYVIPICQTQWAVIVTERQEVGSPLLLYWVALGIILGGMFYQRTGYRRRGAA